MTLLNDRTADAAPLAATRAAHRRRNRSVVLVLAVVLLVNAAFSLAVGAYSLSVPDLLRTLAGQGTQSENFIVLSLRLPRLTLALLVGVAFAISGALFQTVLRNPLASPDIIGATGGASAAAVFGLLILGFGSVATSLAAFAGAVIVACVIYLLAWRGGVVGYRFVLIGVGVAFMVQGLLGYLLSRADLNDAQGALLWLVGSVSGARWQDISVVAVVLLVLLPVILVLSGRLRAEGVTLGYDQTPIIENLDLAIVPGAITVIVGANASGKSTLLKGLSRLITPDAGQVTLGGRNITALPGKKVATVVGLLPQQPVAPDGITVADLVGRGRYPHQGWFRQWSSTDDEIVAAAASGSFPVTIEHAFGETTIDEQPTRVVAWGWGSADDAIALGVIPVAIPFQSFGGDEDGVLPWIAEALEGEEMPLVLPDSQEPPYEDIAAAAPDVILAAYSGITEEEYDLLSEIAPVVAYPGDAWATPGPRRGAT